MANPFPGMDPYLEGPYWVSFRSNLASEMTADLLPNLLPYYAAVTAQRIVATPVDEDDERRNRWPDVGITTDQAAPGGAAAMLDYRKPPPGTFSSDDLAWIDERLRVAGQRS